VTLPKTTSASSTLCIHIYFYFWYITSFLRLTASTTAPTSAQETQFIDFLSDQHYKIIKMSNFLASTLSLLAMLLVTASYRVDAQGEWKTG
jgi:hypothetical protein